MKLNGYFCPFYGYRLRYLYLSLIVGFAVIIGLGMSPYFDKATAVASVTLPKAELPTPKSVQSLNGVWQFLPDSAASTTLTAASPMLPSLDWSQGRPIAVPSNWYLQGHDISGVAWYRHQFPVDEDLADQELMLTFAGVDYASDVWLNGHYLGFHEGYFQTFQFLVSDTLKFGQENELIVRVNSPKEISPQDWSLHKRLIKGVLAHHDARPGGAWSDRGQDKNTGGIWAPVTLRASCKLAIKQVKVTPQVAVDAKEAIAKVNVKVTMPDQQDQSIQVKAQLLPANFEDVPGPVLTFNKTVSRGDNTVTLQIPQQNPHLWWTWDHGNPDLYILRLQFLEGDHLLDTWETRFGFRTVEWDDHEQVFRLNGHRIFLRGTNYIPSQWFSELTPSRIAQDFNLMQEAYINSIRVHAHITTPIFYDQADAIGLLVWQDFPLQWGYQDTPEFIREAVGQGQEMIAQLYNHPSIFVWSLHNEPPWDAFWMADKYATYNPDQNRQLDNELYKALQMEDQTRYLHLASVTAEHPWWGWYAFTYDHYGKPTDQPLITEFGAQALPDYASLTRIFDATVLWPKTEADWTEWQYHNFQPHETFNIAQVAMGTQPDDFIYNTQQYQAKLHQYAAESYRRQRYQPVSAIFQFMFCEPWPSVNWGMVDYWRNSKAGYFALKKAYQPILPGIEAPAKTQIVGESFPIKLWAINDTWESLSGATLTYALKQGNHTLETAKIPFDLDADASKILTSLDVKPTIPGNYTLIATIQDSQNHSVSRNQYTLAVIPKD